MFRLLFIRFSFLFILAVFLIFELFIIVCGDFLVFVLFIEFVILILGIFNMVFLLEFFDDSFLICIVGEVFFDFFFFKIFLVVT